MQGELIKYVRYPSRQNNGPPEDVHILIPGTCEYFGLQSRGDLLMQMELRLLNDWL